MIRFLSNVSHRTFRWVTLFWTLVILFLTLSEQSADKGWLSQIPHIDKVVHFGIFFIWSLFLSLCYRKHPFTEFLSSSSIILAGMLLGFITEYLQSYIPNRSADVLDFITDMAGIGAGLVFTFIIKKNK